MAFGDNLQILRKGKNISQEKLAEELKVSRQTIGKWENNVSYPEAECLIEISEFFGVSIDTLLKGTVTDCKGLEMVSTGESDKEDFCRTEPKSECLTDKKQRNRKIRFVEAILFFVISPFYPGRPGANTMNAFFMILCVAAGTGLLLYNHLTKDQAE